MESSLELASSAALVTSSPLESKKQLIEYSLSPEDEIAVNEALKTASFGGVLRDNCNIAIPWEDFVRLKDK